MKQYAIMTSTQRGADIHQVLRLGWAENDDEMVGRALRTVKEECPLIDGWHSHVVTVLQIP